MYNGRGREAVLYEIVKSWLDQHNATKNDLFDVKIMFLLGNRYIAAVFRYFRCFCCFCHSTLSSHKIYMDK